MADNRTASQPRLVQTRSAKGSSSALSDVVAQEHSGQAQQQVPKDQNEQLKQQFDKFTAMTVQESARQRERVDELMLQLAEERKHSAAQLAEERKHLAAQQEQFQQQMANWFTSMMGEGSVKPVSQGPTVDNTEDSMDSEPQEDSDSFLDQDAEAEGMETGHSHLVGGMAAGGPVAGMALPSGSLDATQGTRAVGGPVDAQVFVAEVEPATTAVAVATSSSSQPNRFAVLREDRSYGLAMPSPTLKHTRNTVRRSPSVNVYGSLPTMYGDNSNGERPAGVAQPRHSIAIPVQGVLEQQLNRSMDSASGMGQEIQGRSDGSQVQFKVPKPVKSVINNKTALEELEVYLHQRAAVGHSASVWPHLTVDAVREIQYLAGLHDISVEEVSAMSATVFFHTMRRWNERTDLVVNPLVDCLTRLDNSWVPIFSVSDAKQNIETLHALETIIAEGPMEVIFNHSSKSEERQTVIQAVFEILNGSRISSLALKTHTLSATAKQLGLELHKSIHHQRASINNWAQFWGRISSVLHQAQKAFDNYERYLGKGIAQPDKGGWKQQLKGSEGGSAKSIPQEDKKGVKSKSRPTQSTGSVKGADKVNCWGCGRDGHRRNDCLLVKSKHPDVNLEKCCFKDSTKGKAWIAKGQKNVPRNQDIKGNTVTSKSFLSMNRSILPVMQETQSVRKTSNREAQLELYSAKRKWRKVCTVMDTGSDVHNFIDPKVVRASGLRYRVLAEPVVVVTLGGRVRFRKTAIMEMRMPDTGRMIKECALIGKLPEGVDVVLGNEVLTRFPILLDFAIAPVGRNKGIASSEGSQADAKYWDTKLEELAEGRRATVRALYNESKAGKWPGGRNPEEVALNIIPSLEDDNQSSWKTEAEQRDEQTITLDNGMVLGGTKVLQQRLNELCELYADVLTEVLPAEAAKVAGMTLDVDAEWITSSKYKLPPRTQGMEKDAELHAQVTDLLARGILRQSTALSWSQALLVSKPKGGWRLCIDYRYLNLLTTEDHHPLPYIVEMLDRTAGNQPKVFGVADMPKGYYQLSMAEASRSFTAFITSRGKYEWTRVPMGLKGAPAVFQRAMSTFVLQGLVHLICEVYMDDILVYGQNEEDFLKNWTTVLERFRSFNMVIGPHKCTVGVQKVEFVGHTLESDRKHFSPQKLQKLREFAKPVTEGELKKFLGLANYYRDHHYRHSEKVAILQAMIPDYAKSKRRHQLQWTKEATQAFESVCDAIVNCPPLYFLRPEGEVCVHTDASDIGWGAFMTQQQEGTWRPIAMLSHTFSDVQQRWSVPEREAYAIFRAVDDWSRLLSGRRFTLYTDHRNLLYIKKNGSGKVIRWQRRLLEFDVVPKYIQGEANGIADFLSRNTAAEEDRFVDSEAEPEYNWLDQVSPTPERQQEPKQQEAKALLSTRSQSAAVVPPVSPGLRKDEPEERVMSIPAAGKTKALQGILKLPQAKIVPSSVQRNKVLHIPSNWHVPEEAYQRILTQHNDDVGHHGQNQTAAMLQAAGQDWSGMSNDIAKFIHCCDVCQKGDASMPPVSTAKFVTSTVLPMQEWAVDTMGPFTEDTDGCQYLMVVLDTFTRHLGAYVMKSNTAAETAKWLAQHMAWFGTPERLVCDNGTEYKNALVAALVKLRGIQHRSTIAYSKEENSLVERANKEVLRWIRDRLHGQQWTQAEWSSAVPHAVEIYNSTVNGSTKQSPNQLVLGPRNSEHFRWSVADSVATFPEAVQDFVSRNQAQREAAVAAASKLQQLQHQKHLTTKPRKGTEFPIGSYVLVKGAEGRFKLGGRESKLHMIWKGPLEVMSSSSKGSVTLHNLVSGLISEFTVHRCKPFHFDEQRVNPLDVALKDKTDTYEVERISAHRGSLKQRRKLLVQVHWAGFSDPTWEPYANVRDTEAWQVYTDTHNVK